MGTPRLRARQFGLEEIEDAAAFASQINRERANVYFGVAPRREDITCNTRARDSDCLPSDYIWLDLDEAGAAESAIVELENLGVSSSYSVVTGKYPHKRVQMFFKLAEPISDHGQLTTSIKALAQRLGGDPKVSNIGRLMRLGGSIAWPSKPGRVAEITEYCAENGSALQLVTYWEKLELEDAKLQIEQLGSQESGIVREAEGIMCMPGKVVDGREEFMRDCVMAAFIEAVGAAEEPESVTWQTIKDLAWPVFRDNVDMKRPGHNTEEEMDQKCKAILKKYEEGKFNEFPDHQTVRTAWLDRQEMELVTPAIRVEQVPVDEKKAVEVNVMRIGDFVRDFTPPDYLIDGVAQSGTLISLTAPTGIGKTAVSIAISMAIQSGSNIDNIETKQGRVVYLCGENPDDVRMRILMMCKVKGIDPDKLDIYVVDGTFDIASAHKSLENQAEKIGGVTMVVVDTLMAYFQGDDDNSNAQMAAYARDVLRPLTRLPGHPCVIVPAHPVKNARSKDLMVPRGGGAFLNEVDANLCLTSDGEGVVQLHWAGKIRGPEFDPVPFVLEELSHEEVTDSEGRVLKSVMARAAAEKEIRNRMGDTITLEDDVLLLLDAMKEPSIRRIAEELPGATKSKVERAIKILKEHKMVKTRRRTYVLTKSGKAEVERIRTELDQKHQWRSK